MSDGHECIVCGKEFDSDRGLKIHQGQVHSDEEIEEAESDEGDKVSEDSNETDKEKKDDDSEEKIVKNSKENESSMVSSDINVSLKSAVAVFFLIGIFSGFSLGFLGSSIEGPDINFPEFNFSSEDKDLEFQTVEIGNITPKDDPSLGDKEAPIKIIQYTDFGCPYCSEWHGHDASPTLDADTENIFQKFKEELIDTGKVEFIIKDHPAPKLHPNSIRAHAAANCVYKQDKDEYWSFVDELYSTRDTWTTGGENRTASHFESMANERDNIDTESFIQCYLSTDGSEMVEDRNNALRNIGELGTPTFLIGNKKDGFVTSSGITRVEEFRRAINQVQN